MAKLRVFIKMSGSLLKNEEVVTWLRKISQKNLVTICIGGGAQINRAFKKRGFKIKFGPLGRITESEAQRRLAVLILHKNRDTVVKILERKKICAGVIFPLLAIGPVPCLVNGDLEILAAYNGYDRLYLLTLKERVTKKKLWLKRVAKVFRAIGKGELDKIKVIGF